MHGARRVIVFCLLTAVLPTVLLIIPLYLRHSVYANVTYAVAESDVLEVVDGMSTIFCQEQLLQMNSTFHAFQLKSLPKVSNTKKHVSLKKSMILPDDTLEYWGFYLLGGSQIMIQACSSHDGARILVVEGERNLRTCGLMQHAKYPTIPLTGTHKAFHAGKVSVMEVKEVPQQVQRSVQHSVDSEHTKIDTEDTEFEGEIEDMNDSATNSSIDEDLDSSVKTLEKSLEHHINKLSLHYPIKNTSHSHNHKTNQRQQRRVRHIKRKLMTISRENNTFYKHNVKIETENAVQRQELTRHKREMKVVPGRMLSSGIGHGGNAANFTEDLEPESSQSSFEISLFSCYQGKVEMTYNITTYPNCSSSSVVNVGMAYTSPSDGYYYLIFYSDNDLNQNSIHAQFNIHKVTYEYANYSRRCINQTECRFPIKFWSDEIVIVEVPTRDGIEHEDVEMTYLISSCYPRMSVYIIFPITVLFLVLGCAFL